MDCIHIKLVMTNQLAHHGPSSLVADSPVSASLFAPSARRPYRPIWLASVKTTYCLFQARNTDPGL